MMITRKQLKKIILEEFKRSRMFEYEGNGGNDTDVYAGDHDPITVEIPALEALATKKNFDGEKVWFDQYDAAGIADALESGEPDIETFNYDEVRYNKAMETWNKITEPIQDWERDDMEELAQNIRAAIQSADEAGYEY
jgi:hypothetical protein